MKHFSQSQDEEQDQQVRQLIESLRVRWLACRLVSGSTPQIPAHERGRLSRVDARVVLMVALRPRLRYRRLDGGWHQLAADEVFFMRGGEWQERDIAHDYDQLKVAVHGGAVELVRNRNNSKAGLRLPAPDPHRWTCLIELIEKGDDGQIHAAWALVLAEVLQALSSPASFPGPGARRFEALCEHLREQVALEHSRESLAAVIGCHPTHVTRLFTRFAGCTYSAWLERERLTMVRQLLRTSELNIGAIAERSGFASANYLIRRFRAAEGITPARWRQRR